MLDWIRFILCAVVTAGGLFCLLSGVVGAYKFRYSLSRIHAAALLDTVGILLMLLGVSIATGFSITSVKMFIVIAFLWLTSPVSGHLIARLEVTTDDDLAEDASVLDQAYVEQEKEPEETPAAGAPAKESSETDEEKEAQ